MRRIDKEIDNFREVWAIINACRTARVAMVDAENKPYVVPMNFGFTAEATGPVFYFHCASSGQKLDIRRSASSWISKAAWWKRRSPVPTPTPI